MIMNLKERIGISLMSTLYTPCLRASMLDYKQELPQRRGMIMNVHTWSYFTGKVELFQMVSLVRDLISQVPIWSITMQNPVLIQFK